MIGVVKYRLGKGFVELREVEEKELLPNQVKVEVKASGICGSDIHIYHGDINIPVQPPVIVGHEFSGVVVEKGTEVEDDIQIGDRVTGEPSAYVCGRCRYCRSEHYNLCPSRRILGYTADGSFAPYCNATYVHRLPDNVSFRAGALTELLAGAVHGVTEQTGISAGDFVAVLGPGPLGLFAASVAMAEGGIVCVCGTERDNKRLELAAQLGAYRTLNIQECDAVDEVRRMTDGYGADVVLECAGAESSARMGIEMVRKRGKYTQMGLFGRPIEIDFEKVAFKEIEVGGFVSHRPPCWQRALKLMELGVIQAEGFITHEFTLTQWKKGFDIMESKNGVKILLLPE
jgi:L-iditol 2-dehydrogenase